MNTMTDTPSLAVTGKHRMTPSEAFVETLVAHGVKDVFGIVGSAYMDALDLFPLAGIRFISVAHEQGGGHMADGYARVSGRQGVCIAQNGPGVTNFVTSVAAAYWAHSPVVCITPETGSGTLGLGGFQETEQLPIFSKITKFQAHVNNRARMAELTGRAFDRALLEMGPTQLNIPRDYFYGDIECEIPRPIEIERGAGGEKSLDEAALLLASAEFPVVLAGGRSSRLYHELVYQKRLARSVDADYSGASIDPMGFSLTAQLLPGIQPAAVEREIDGLLNKLKTELISERELQKAKNQIEASFIFAQDSIFGQAMKVGSYEAAGGLSEWRKPWGVQVGCRPRGRLSRTIWSGEI